MNKMVQTITIPDINSPTKWNVIGLLEDGPIKFEDTCASYQVQWWKIVLCIPIAYFLWLQTVIGYFDEN